MSATLMQLGPYLLTGTIEELRQDYDDAMAELREAEERHGSPIEAAAIREIMPRFVARMEQRIADTDAAEDAQQVIDDAWWDAYERDEDIERERREEMAADLRAEDQREERQRQWEEDYYAALSEEQHKADRED